MKLRSLTLAGAFVVAIAAAAPAAHAAKPNPENDAKAAPNAHAGYFLGTQGPTYSWHGCTATATQRTLSAMQKPIAGEPAIDEGTKPKAVRFTTSPSAPFVSWKANAGWRICGAQASVVLYNPTVDALLWSQVGYSSGPTSGSTSPISGEEHSVKIPKRTFGAGDYKKFDGKTFSIREIRAVTIFVKKRR